MTSIKLEAEMVQAELIAVGTELLMGQVVNTNTSYLARKCQENNINVYYHHIVGDNPERLAATFKQALKRSDLVILTGGLGPTDDDLTKQVVAKCLGRELRVDKEASENIRRFHQKLNREITQNNWRQAEYIDGSRILKNHNGLAVGDYFVDNGSSVILLPGPPNEMKMMFEREVLPIWQDTFKSNGVMRNKILRFYGIGESKLTTEIQDIIESQVNPTVASYVNDYEVSLRLTANASDDTSAAVLLRDTGKKIKERVGEYCFSDDQFESLEYAVVYYLTEKGLTISAAESLTAGLFQAMVADAPGASKVLTGGMVTYQTIEKERLLGIPEEIVDTFGVVSSECAAEMAKRVKEKTGSDIGVGLTGVAGPETQEGKEVGTVFIGLAYDDSVRVKELHLSGVRVAVRKKAVKEALDLVIKNIIA